MHFTKGLRWKAVKRDVKKPALSPEERVFLWFYGALINERNLELKTLYIYLIGTPPLRVFPFFYPHAGS